jgi:hypothetical protein
MGYENIQEAAQPLAIRIGLSKARRLSEVADTEDSTGKDAARRSDGE